MTHPHANEDWRDLMLRDAEADAEPFGAPDVDAGRRSWEAGAPNTDQIPTKEGDATLTTVEARGCPDVDAVAGVSSAAAQGVGRAAGALLTGQSQDGPSRVPACEQDPAATHAGRGTDLSPDGPEVSAARGSGGIPSGTVVVAQPAPSGLHPPTRAATLDVAGQPATASDGAASSSEAPTSTKEQPC